MHNVWQIMKLELIKSHISLVDLSTAFTHCVLWYAPLFGQPPINTEKKKKNSVVFMT